MSRPVMADRQAIITAYRKDIDTTAERGRHRVTTQVSRESDRVAGLARHLRAVSPQHTLERGYAVVRHSDGAIVRDIEEVEPDELLRVTVARGAACGPPGRHRRPWHAEPTLGAPRTGARASNRRFPRFPRSRRRWALHSCRLLSKPLETSRSLSTPTHVGVGRSAFGVRS